MAIFNQLMNNFSALQLREQVLAVVVGSAVLALGGNILLLKPLQTQIDQLRAMDKQHKAGIASAIADLSAVDGQLARGIDPLEKERATRDDFLHKIAEADAFFMHNDATGAQVASLVRSVLDESPGLSLVAMKTLPAQVFYAPPAPPPPPKATEKAISTAVEGIAKVLPFGLPETAAAAAQAPPPPVALQKTI